MAIAQCGTELPDGQECASKLNDSNLMANKLLPFNYPSTGTE